MKSHDVDDNDGGGGGGGDIWESLFTKQTW